MAQALGRSESDYQEVKELVFNKVATFIFDKNVDELLENPSVVLEMTDAKSQHALVQRAVVDFPAPWDQSLAEVCRPCSILLQVLQVQVRNDEYWSHHGTFSMGFAMQFNRAVFEYRINREGNLESSCCCRACPTGTATPTRHHC